MEERAVCYYCATIYPAEQEKCPLCGSTKRAEDYVIPQRRERLSEEERKQRQRSSKGGGKYVAQKAPKKKTPKKRQGTPLPEDLRKKLLVGALIFLSLAALVLFWFIGDMIGWFPGLENRVERETEPGVSVNVDCTELFAEPTRLNFAAPGQALDLTVSVNLTCEDKLYCTSNDPAIVTVSETVATAEGTELKSIIFTATAGSEGSTVITVSCGNLTMGIPVTVAPGEENEETTAPVMTVTPELNWAEVEFTTLEESVTLKVTNLPEGATVIWMSGDESVASVDADGVVTPVATGETFITCDVNGSTAQVKIRCDLSTTNTNDDGAHLESTDVTVRVGDKFPLYLYNSKSEHIDDISYVVDDAAICEVVDNYVKALSSGTTKIRVIYGDLEFVCIVRVG